MGLFSNNNQEVLDKLRQVINEVLELRAEESARSTELIKQLGALNEKVGLLSAKMSEANAKIAGLNQHACTLEGFISNCATKTMMEMLGKKVNEIGKTVDDHFESFVNVSEKDTELFKLIAQALTGKMVEEEASAEPKLTEKVKKNERRKKKNEGAKEAASVAEKTVSGTDGNGGKERKTVVIESNIEILAGSIWPRYFRLPREINIFLVDNGFRYMNIPKEDDFKELSFRKTLRKSDTIGSTCSLLNSYEVKNPRIVESLLQRFGDYFGCVLRCNSHYCKLSFKE